MECTLHIDQVSVQCHMKVDASNYLGYVEVIAYSKINKDFFVLMKALQGSLHLLQCRVRVRLILSVVNKVQYPTHCREHAAFNHSSNHRQKHPLQFLVITPHLLLAMRDPFFEMLETMVGSHFPEPCVQLLSAHDFSNPAYNVVLENTLVQLVKNIGRDRREYITVRELGPEGFVDSAQAKVSKLTVIETAFLMVLDIFQC